MESLSRTRTTGRSRNGSRSRVSWKCPETHRSLHQQQCVPHGVVHHHTYLSQTTSSERGVYVYTPPGYRVDGTEQYPLLVLMHGYGDDESAWLEVGRANWIADNLIAQDKAVPMVIAMPYGHPLPLARSGTFDDYATRNEAAMEQDLLHDLFPLLAAQYRLKQDRLQRAIVGLSMGGGQSLTIGLSNLDRFAWIGGFSSAPPRGDVDGKFADLLQDVAATNDQVKLLWIGCGKEDFLLERNQQFHSWLSEKKIDHTFQLTDGGHDWMVWRKYLAEFLPQLFRDSRRTVGRTPSPPVLPIATRSARWTDLEVRPTTCRTLSLPRPSL